MPENVLDYGRTVDVRGRLRRILILVVSVIVALAAGVVALEFALDPGTPAGVAAKFRARATLPEGVTLVSVETMFPDEYVEVSGVTLAFADGTVVRLRGADPDLTKPRRDVVIDDFDGWRVGQTAFGESYNIRTATGERVPSHSYWGGMDLGSTGPLSDRLPNGPLRSVADLRDRLAEVRAFFEALPQYPEYFEHRPRDHPRRLTASRPGGKFEYPPQIEPDAADIQD